VYPPVVVRTNVIGELFKAPDINVVCPLSLPTGIVASSVPVNLRDVVYVYNTPLSPMTLYLMLHISI